MTRKIAIEKLVKQYIKTYEKLSIYHKKQLLHFLLVSYYNNMTDLQISKLFEENLL